MKTVIFISSIILLSLCSCNSEKNNEHTGPDLILYNGIIHTMDENNPSAQAIAVRGGKITAVGSNQDIRLLAKDSTQSINLNGHTAIPGFIEGHGHFSSLGNSLINIQLADAKTWDEIVAKVKARVSEVKPGEWIYGRGWHQEKWTKDLRRQFEGYPYHDDLSLISPDNPVLLSHASGHALFANKKAMQIAGVSKETPNPKGGMIVRDNQGVAIGVFEENAEEIIFTAYQTYLQSLGKEAYIERWERNIRMAEEDCLQKGICSFQDAGADLEEIERYRTMAENGDLNVRIWTMILDSTETIRRNAKKFPIFAAGEGHFTVRAIKSYVDGALGSYGAWLLEPYSDRKNSTGQVTTPVEDLKILAEIAIQNDLQLCLHAIGDRANREILDLYENTFKSQPEKTDLRWRIEHAQHINITDIPRFGKMGVIASMQAVHCTSDAPFVEERLGFKRASEEAYPWRELLDSGAIIANGTDAPVEDVNPLASFYSAVTRKTSSGESFFPLHCMTREEALRSYTLHNAYAAFEEDVKGSLAPGKYGDITVLSNDILNCPEEDIQKTKILYTIVGGKIKYRQE